MTSLKRVLIPSYGPFVFGRKETILRTVPSFVPPVKALPRAVALVDHNAIRDAAQTLHPIYRAEEDIDANDIAGDCTAAAMMHIGAILQALKGGVWRLPTATDALSLYSKTTTPPYNIATRENDNGADLGTVLDYVAKFGAYPDGTFKITSPVAVDATNPTQVRAALDKHRVLYMGAALADAWIPTDSVAKVWDVAGPPDDNDGHCTAAYDYNDQGVQINTWGCFLTVTWAALAKYWGAQAGGELYAFDMAA